MRRRFAIGPTIRAMPMIMPGQPIASGTTREAEKGWDAALLPYRELAASDPDAYRPDVADMLTYLGDLYRDTGRLGEAERAYKEALAIRRDLAARNPAAHRRGMATTLNNLGVFDSSTGRPGEAEKAYDEALVIRRDLA